MADGERVLIENVVVGHADGRDLVADLYRPPRPNGAAVLLIIFFTIFFCFRMTHSASPAAAAC